VTTDPESIKQAAEDYMHGFDKESGYYFKLRTAFMNGVAAGIQAERERAALIAANQLHHPLACECDGCTAAYEIADAINYPQTAPAP
jgi:hypothetical protein